jgi:hypothetical protein
MNRGSFLLVATALALAGCGGGDKAALDKIDSKLGGKGDADPALTAALEDQIMVDPSLSGQANDDAIRPASEPNQTPVPPSEGSKAAMPGQTLGGLAAEQAEIAKDSFNGCELTVQYSMDYAARLPADLPLYPQAQVSEAAGSDAGGCHLRAVSHNSIGTLKQVAQHYAGAATRAGYTVASKADAAGMMVSGKRAADGGAFYVVITPNGAGTSADLVVNNGR